MAQDFKNQIAKVKEAYNIVDLVEDENVQLKQSGMYEYTGLCPFHNEKTPSFKVNESFQNYHCFGCGAKGDAISFIEHTRGLSFIESLNFLAEAKGISLELDDSYDEKPKYEMTKLYALVKDAYDFYRAEFLKLDVTHPAKQEIIKRGFTVDNDIYGYAPESYGVLYNHLKEKGYSEELMLQSELIMEKDGKYFDFFYGRLLFAICDFTGRPLSFSSRKLFEKDQRGKYVNGKASPVFEKKSVLFNIHRAKKSARMEHKIFLTEGQFDVEAFRAADYENVVASSGTAFTDGHLKSARQLVGGDGELIFAFDGDSAGVEAALRIFRTFPISHDISKVILAPNDMDPADVFLAHGKTGMDELVASATPIADFVITALAKEMKITDMPSRYNYIKKLCSEYLVEVTDSIILDYMIRRASIVSGLDIAKIEEVLKNVKKPNRREINHSVVNEEELEIEIPLNEEDDSDKCYITGISMLVWRSDILVDVSRGLFVPRKFLGFLEEFTSKYLTKHAKGEQFKFIVEDYQYEDFARYLQSVDMSMLKSLTDEELIEYYLNIMKKGERFYKEAEKQQRTAEMLETFQQARSNEEIIEMLELMEKMKEEAE